MKIRIYLLFALLLTLASVIIVQNVVSENDSIFSDDSVKSINNNVDAQSSQVSPPPMGGDDDSEKGKKEYRKIYDAVKKVYEEYTKALTKNDYEAILKLHDLSDKDAKEEATEYFKNLCTKVKNSYKDFDWKGTSQIGDKVFIEFKYKQKAKDKEEWEDKVGCVYFVEIKNEWKIKYITLKVKWEEARDILERFKKKISKYKEIPQLDLSDILSEEWEKASVIKDRLKYQTKLLDLLLYFDADDFVFKLKKGSKKDYILKCDASLGKGRGAYKTGPETGTLIYESDTDKWTENFKPDDKKETKEEKPKIEPKDDE